ncbi:hypothetical protein AVEN_178185-1 [Araneus ventricosus]|uniref:Uncharacterized protein n=1 Tax=Araneus ventricosus TaxID=182803 RepID=A0A4Y2TZ01_ARAVE|nr:hypothetical protein AVEN_178185-1 [Araneus ventricosus]
MVIFLFSDFKGRCGLMARTWLRGRRDPGLEWNCRASGPGAHYIRRGQMSLRWCGRTLGEGVPAQVSSPISEEGSKLRGPSPESQQVAAKRVVNITKL